MKFNYLQFRKLRVALMVLSVAWGSALFAQPANDICSNAISINVAADLASCVWTGGTTLNVVDGATQVSPKSPCSTTFVRDDVWYKFSVPAGSTKKAITLKVEAGSLPGDMASVGLAVYSNQSCAASNSPMSCLNFAAGADSKTTFSVTCGQDYLVRIWSSAGTAADWKIGQGAFRVCAYFEENASKSKVLWGNNGEGSFNGGLNGWTTGGSVCGNGSTPPNSLWEWRATADSHGPLWGGQVINSLSACNGAMLFDSDYWDGAGGCSANQQGWLESPKIDLSGFIVAGVAVEFHQRVTQFLSEFYIDYSTDDGQNWSSVTINEDIVPFNTGTPPGVDPTADEIRRVYLPNVGNSAQLRIRFRTVANYYYWLVDDVVIVEREAYNTKVNPFYAIAPNKITQKDQLEGFGGLADVANIGAKTAKNVKLKLEIADPNSILWTDVLNYGDILPDSTVENIPMPGTFNYPTKNVTDYQGLYTISADSTDFDLTDNTRLFDWSTSDSIMAKENTNPVSGGVRPASNVNFTWGNIYHIVNGKNSAGKQLVCNFIDIGVSNPDSLAGATIFAWIYKWVDANDDQIVQTTERTTLGYAQYDFPVGEQANTLYSFPIVDFLTFNPGVKLEDNTDYIVAAQYSAPADNNTKQCFICSDGTIDYSAHDLRTTLPGFGPSRPSHVLDVGGTGDFNVGTFTGGTVPVVRMHITEATSTSEPQLDPANTVVIAPNPAANDVNVKINLVKDAKTVKMNVVDANGKVVLTKELNNIKSTTETFNVSNLANGNYLLNVATDAGVRSVKFIVVK